jgi:CRP/FNR family transcriptional regulator, cyclic AMP receptor protein
MPSATAKPDEATLITALNNEALQAIATQGRVRHFPKNTVIINEGDHGDSIFIILSGMVKVYAVGSEGKEVALNFIGKGELVGELAIDGEPRTASVMTIEPTACSMISRNQLLETIKADPNFALQLISLLIKRTRRATREVKRLALESVYARIAALFEEDGVKSNGSGHHQLPYKLTQQELASRVGASREMVNRVLKELVEGGYISIKQKIITIKRTLPARF